MDTKKIREEKREEPRIPISLDARISGRKCTVLNVSHKGILLLTDLPFTFFSISKQVEFTLKIKETWINIKGYVKWINSGTDDQKVGICIKQAPPLYIGYLKNIYC